MYFLEDIKISSIKLHVLYCDNIKAIHIAVNLVFHARTKHLENDCYLAKEKLQAGLLKMMPFFRGLNYRFLHQTTLTSTISLTIIQFRDDEHMSSNLWEDDTQEERGRINYKLVLRITNLLVKLSSYNRLVSYLEEKVSIISMC